MKRSRLILSSFVVIITVALLAGGGGITYILHKCQMCDISTATTLSVLNPSVEEDDCCGGEMGCEGDDKNLASACCDFNIGQLKIDNFVFSTNIIPDVACIQLFTSHSELIEYPTQQVNRPIYILNKHGGRFIVNANCQLLS